MTYNLDRRANSPVEILERELRRAIASEQSNLKTMAEYDAQAVLCRDAAREAIERQRTLRAALRQLKPDWVEPVASVEPEAVA